MKNIIKDFKISPLNDTSFVHPLKFTYSINGKNKIWEAVKSFDSVAILLYDEEKEAFLLVKQFRAPVYYNDKSKLYTYELCAGIVDKDLSLAQIVKEEVLEECGYNVSINDIEKITSFNTNVGVSGSLQTLFFAKINDDMKQSEGGGIHDEEIQTIFVSLKDYEDFIYDESKAKTSGLMFSFLWFMQKKRYKENT